MIQNVNPTTGVRYGVIACNNLDQDLVETLFYGSQATNVSEEEAAAEAEAELREQYRGRVHQSHLAAKESGADREDGFDREAYEECWFEEHSYDYDEDWFIEKGIKDGMYAFQIEEPTITGTHEGVEYMILWLGGAPLLWSLKGPIVRSRRLCSPCIPGAIDLDSKFIYASMSYDNSVESQYSYQGYGVPADWLAKEPA